VAPGCGRRSGSSHSFTVAGLIGLALHKTMGFRIDKDAEIVGIDVEEHAESSYDLGSLGGGGLVRAGAAMFGSNHPDSASEPSMPKHQGASS
jgi:Amt family ammonium transporter